MSLPSPADVAREAEALRRGVARANHLANVLSDPRRRAAPPAVPQVSVVVQTCGRPALLVRCLDALRAQTCEPSAYEIVVVDDGCCDATRSLVLTLAAEAPTPAIRYLRPAAGRKGPAQARNLGWMSASGDVIAFTDDDTIPAPDWLERGEAALTGTRGEAGRPWAALAGRVVVPPPPDPALPTDPERMVQGRECTEFVAANAFVQRAALFEIGGFDERFTRAWREDLDLQFRLQAEIGPVGRCEEAVVVHPARRERWGVSLQQQKNAYFEALLYAKHPQRYRQHVGLPVPWDCYAIVVLAVAALALAWAGIGGSAFVSAAIAVALVMRFAIQRLRGGANDISHVAEMLATSALIPFLSVFWRLRGALHFRIWFL